MGGSGWVIKEWLVFAMDMSKIKPARGGSYIPTPRRYANSKCGLINIKTKTRSVSNGDEIPPVGEEEER
jgi:hypothetical protein